MSHHLDVDSVLEKLVLLEHFSAGSRSYCAEHRIGSRFDQGDGELDDYWSWTKGIVCAYALDCAIKFRVLQDSTTGQAARELFGQIDARSRAGLNLGAITHGTFELTLREVSNKIIHATRVVPEWKASRTRGFSFKFWSGTLALSGARGSGAWELQLKVASWAQAMQRFLADSETEEALRYVGQDWFPSKGAA